MPGDERIYRKAGGRCFRGPLISFSHQSAAAYFTGLDTCKACKYLQQNLNDSLWANKVSIHQWGSIQVYRGFKALSVISAATDCRLCSHLLSLHLCCCLTAVLLCANLFCWPLWPLAWHILTGLLIPSLLQCFHVKSREAGKYVIQSHTKLFIQPWKSLHFPTL